MGASKCRTRSNNTMIGKQHRPPPGVGLGKKPTPVFLKAGQTMKLGIAGLGEQTQKLVASA